MSAHTGTRTGKRNGHASPPPSDDAGWTERAIEVWGKTPDHDRVLFHGDHWRTGAQSEHVLALVRFAHHKMALIDLLSMATWDDGFGAEDFRPYQFRCAREQWEQLDKEENERRSFAAALIDPWADPPPPAWPAGILAPHFEDTVAEIALADGVDMGAQAMAFLAAASGAADKQSRLDVYLNGRFKVPPILWVAVVAESGMRKSAMLQTAFAAIKREGGKRWGDYEHALNRYERQSREEKRDDEKPRAPSSLMVDDITPESLAEVLAGNPRGPLMAKEELVSLFEFGRYGSTSGAAGRGFLLTTYDGSDTWFHRKATGGVHIANAAMTIFGCTQPSRLAKFKDLEDDGLLQRFLLAVPGTARSASRPDVEVRGVGRIEAAIAGLVHRGPMQYRLSEAGAAMVRATERRSGELERLSDDGLGFPAWVRKMHGQHARLAFAMHLMEAPAESVIADDVVERAGRLMTEYLLPCALNFYGKLPDSGQAMMRTIGGWLLTKAKPRFTSADVQAGNAGVKKGLRDVQAALDPFITGGWIEPETEYPNNRAWTLVDGVREAFAERTAAERERRRQLYELVRGKRRA